MNSAAPFEGQEGTEATSMEEGEREHTVDGVPSGMTAVYGRRPGRRARGLGRPSTRRST